MKTTPFLCRLNSKFSMLRLIKFQWFAYGKKKIVRTQMEQFLKERNIPVYDAMKEVEPTLSRNIEEFITPDWKDKPLVEDSTHPNWHDEPCFTYKDHNVFVDGLNQAKLFTNTVEVRGGLPSDIENLYDKIRIEHQNEIVQSILLSSLVYDMTQEKLPKRKDPERPAWNFRRDYGVQDKRRNFSLCNKLLNLCEMMVGPSTANRRTVFHDAVFQVPLTREDKNVLITLRADLLLLADQPLQQNKPPFINSLLPATDMSPMTCTISLDENNIYQMNNLYPIKNNAEFNYPHTAFIYFNETEVQNIYETPVLESQILGRSLMKAFAIAASKARSQYGEDVKKLPSPITVQCIQTDSHNFHFNVFQLNTLEWPPVEGEYNIFWSDVMTKMYESCGYKEAKPFLNSYNPDVFTKLLAFYMNGASH